MNRGKLHEYFLKYPRIGKKVRELFYMITVPSKKEREKIKFEIHLAEHCNLNCKCCNNFSPLANEEYLNYDIFLRDIQRMKSGTNYTNGWRTLIKQRYMQYNLQSKACIL